MVEDAPHAAHSCRSCACFEKRCTVAGVSGVHFSYPSICCNLCPGTPFQWFNPQSIQLTRKCVMVANRRLQTLLRSRCSPTRSKRASNDRKRRQPRQLNQNHTCYQADAGNPQFTTSSCEACRAQTLMRSTCTFLRSIFYCHNIYPSMSDTNIFIFYV